MIGLIGTGRDNRIKNSSNAGIRKRFRPLLVCAFLLTFLSACNGGRTAEEDAAPGTTLYEENFSNPSGGWLRYGNENGALDYFGGAYRIIVVTPAYDLWAVSGKSFADVSLTVDAGPLSGPANNRYGLICRYVDPDNFYFFIVSADGFYGLGIVQDGKRHLLGQEMMAYNASIKTGFAFNRLRFDCKGNTLNGYVNGQMLAIITDSTFLFGDVGLLAGTFDTPGTDIVFDNFLVIKP